MENKLTNERLVSGRENYLMELVQVLFDKRGNRVTAGQDSLHLPGQLCADLEEHVIGQNIGDAFIFSSRHLVPPIEHLFVSIHLQNTSK